VQGADAFQAGLRLLPIIGGMLVGAKAAERLVEAAGARTSVVIGFALMLAGLVLGAFTDVDDGYGFTAIWVSLVGVSIGFTLPPMNGLALAALPLDRSGSGSALIQASRQVGGTLGVAILGTVLNAAYRDRLDVTGLPPAAAQAARDSASAAIAIGSPELTRSARAAFVAGMDVTLWVCAGLAVVSVALAVAFLPRRTRVLATIGA